MFGMVNPVHFTLLKKPGSNDSGFFSSVENDNYSVATIRHLGREVRAIRDLLITCLSIKDTDKKLAKIALKTITLQRADNRFPISFVTSL